MGFILKAKGILCSLKQESPMFNLGFRNRPIRYIFNKRVFFSSTVDVEPRASHMLDKLSTTELHP
jgi:hypothetical protein